MPLMRFAAHGGCVGTINRALHPSMRCGVTDDGRAVTLAESNSVVVLPDVLVSVGLSGGHRRVPIRSDEILHTDRPDLPPGIGRDLIDAMMNITRDGVEVGSHPSDHGIQFASDGRLYAWYQPGMDASGEYPNVRILVYRYMG